MVNSGIDDGNAIYEAFAGLATMRSWEWEDVDLAEGDWNILE